MDDVFKILGIVGFVIGMIFIMPFINFWIAYFGGWIAKVIIGEKLAAAINILFHTTYFTKDMLPMLAGALGWIGSFFKNYSTVKNNK